MRKDNRRRHHWLAPRIPNSVIRQYFSNNEISGRLVPHPPDLFLSHAVISVCKMSDPLSIAASIAGLMSLAQGLILSTLRVVEEHAFV